MPIHLDDVEIDSEVAGLSSLLIVPCNMCPAVTVAMREGRPFLRPLRSLLRSAPFERHVRRLRSRLSSRGIRTRVFRNRLPHHWFVCLWTSGRRRKLRRLAGRYEATLVLGCDSAAETVRDALASSGCRVIQGMRAVGYTNARLRIRLPCDVWLEEGRIIPLCGPGDRAASSG
jgi:hypothetical protein